MDTQALVDKTLITIRKFKMLEKGDAVIVSFSGGPDSTALLLILADLRERFDLRLHAWHLNHLIRPTAGAEADRARSVAQRLGVDFLVEESDAKSYARVHGLSVQEAGRTIRYDRLCALSARLGGAKIAVGHNSDDSVETFFINLLRGSGMSGLRGIQPVYGRIIRPLIEAERSAIIDFLAFKRAEYVDDPSNRDERYLRSRVRHELLPLLKKLSPAAPRKILTTMSLIRDDEAWLSSLTEAAFSEVAEVGPADVKLDAKRLAAAPIALQRRLLRLAAASLCPGRVPDFAAIQSIMSAAATGGGTDFGRRGQARRHKDYLQLCWARQPFKSAFIGADGGQVEIDHCLVSVTITSSTAVALPTEAGTLAVDADKVSWPIEIRPRRNGDRFQPLGLGGTKKLQDFFVDAKIPRWQRDAVPVFADAKKVVAVGNMRIDERVKISPTTRTVAVIRAPDLIK